MGLMDKVVAQAGQAMAKAQRGVAQGQERLAGQQRQHARDALLRELGAACYAQARAGGSPDEVAAVMARIDEFDAANPAAPASGSAGMGAPGPAGAGPGGAGQPPVSGDFTLE
jgi:hypothetical protein